MRMVNAFNKIQLSLESIIQTKRSIPDAKPDALCSIGLSPL